MNIWYCSSLGPLWKRQRQNCEGWVSENKRQRKFLKVLSQKKGVTTCVTCTRPTSEWVNAKSQIGKNVRCTPLNLFLALSFKYPPLLFFSAPASQASKDDTMSIRRFLTWASYFSAAASSMAALSTVMPCLIMRSHRHFNCVSQYEFARSRRPETHIMSEQRDKNIRFHDEREEWGRKRVCSQLSLRTAMEG